MIAAPFPFCAKLQKHFLTKGRERVNYVVEGGWLFWDKGWVDTLFNVNMDIYAMMVYLNQHLIFDSLDYNLDLVLIYYRLNIVKVNNSIF